MVTWLNKLGLQSDRGFVVQFTGRFKAQYRADGRLLTLRVENGRGDGAPCIIIDPDAFEHWDGETTPIPSSQRAEMLQNFKEAMEFQGLKLEVERGIGPEGR